jgi:hypothetical protein
MSAAVRKTALVAVLAVTTLTVAMAPSAAAVGGGSRAVQVQGSQIPVDPQAGTFAMRSDPRRPGLVGAWKFTSYLELNLSPDFVVSTGTEMFTGCLDANGDNKCKKHEPSGTLSFNFVAWARMDTSVVPNTEIEGGCLHPVTGGTADFAGATGELSMRDFLVGKDLRTTYRGDLALTTGSSTASGSTTGSVSTDSGSAAPEQSAADGAAAPTAASAGTLPGAMSRAC